MTGKKNPLDAERMTYGTSPHHPPGDIWYRSPYLMVAAVTLIAVAGLIIAWHPTRQLATSSHQKVATQTGSATASGPATPGHATSNASADSSSAPESDEASATQAIATVNAFMHGWLTVDPAQRSKELKPVTSTSLASGLLQTDPPKIPTAKVAGAPQPVLFSSQAGVFSVALTDRSQVEVSVNPQSDSEYGWVVTSVRPEE